MWALLVYMYNGSDAIDSISHIFGTRPFKESHLACNNLFMGIITLGEGWHANHHSFPYSAKHGLLPGQFDWTWQVIRFLEKLGLATKIKLPSDQQITAKLT
jgi:stearoyl-CoA desaturase (delta-9 desaturase)